MATTILHFPENAQLQYNAISALTESIINLVMIWLWWLTRSVYFSPAHRQSFHMDHPALLCSSLWDVTSWHCSYLYWTFDWFRFIWPFSFSHAVPQSSVNVVLGHDIVLYMTGAELGLFIFVSPSLPSILVLKRSLALSCLRKRNPQQTECCTERSASLP